MNNLKAISSNDNELRVGNYIVLFGGKDLTGEHFTKSTDFSSNFTDIGTLYVDFEHGRDQDGFGNSSDNVLGVVDWKSAKIDEKGIFVERVLNRRSKYIQYLEDLINAGVVGTSSESVRGKSLKTKDGEITKWPLMRDSLTLTPMEPRMITENVLASAKALAEIFPESKSLAVVTGGEVAPTISEIEQIQDLKSAESFLRDAGLSRKESTAFVSRVKSLRPRDADEDLQVLKAALVHRNIGNPN